MAAPTAQEIARVVAGKDRAQAAAEYGETIRCQMQLVQGENYQLLWSTAYNGEFRPNE